MSTHVHDWQPIPLACGRYSCTCGETGKRAKHGQIVPLTSDTTKRHWRDHIVEIRPNVTAVRTTSRDNGQVDRAPMLHEVERK